MTRANVRTDKQQLAWLVRGTIAEPRVRALEAVALAARSPKPEHCYGYDPTTGICDCPVHRALRRLDVLSARGGRR